MNQLQLLEALGDVDDTLLQKAREPVPIKRYFAMRMVATAASICLIAGAAAWCLGRFHANLGSVSSAADSNHGAVSSDADEIPDTSLGSDIETKSVDLYIIGWNDDGFLAVASAANSFVDGGTAVQVLMDENTVQLYRDGRQGEPFSYDMNVSNTAAGSQVRVTYSNFVQTDTGIQISATAVTLYTQVKP